MPAASVLIKPVSGMCNMQCRYCFYCDEMNKRKQKYCGIMSEETLRNVIRRTLIPAERSASYVFQGGEPTLRGIPFFEKVIEYQKKYNRNCIHIHNALQTNGLLIDENWCRFLKENHFLVGVSMDGTAQCHDKYRCDKEGMPTFSRIKKNILLMEKYGVDFNILTVVTRNVAENIKEIYKFYCKAGWTYQQYIPCLDPLNEKHGYMEYSVTPEDYGKFLINLFELWYVDWKKKEQPYIRQFENYIGILAGYPAEACDQCGECRVQNVVEADGSVFPCDFYMLDEYCLGNFNCDRIGAVDTKREEIGFIQKSRMLEPSCKKCKYFFICKGGCQRNRDFNIQTGTYSNYFCKSYQMFFETCLDRMMEMVKASGLSVIKKLH